MRILTRLECPIVANDCLSMKSFMFNLPESKVMFKGEKLSPEYAHRGFKEILFSDWPFLELLLQIRILNVKFLLEFILRYIVSPILFFCPLKGL